MIKRTAYIPALRLTVLDMMFCCCCCSFCCLLLLLDMYDAVHCVARVCLYHRTGWVVVFSALILLVGHCDSYLACRYASAIIHRSENGMIPGKCKQTEK